MYCEDPSFVISVAYKIQFGSKNHVITSRAEYKQFSRFEELLGLLTQLQQDTLKEISWIFFCYSESGTARKKFSVDTCTFGSKFMAFEKWGIHRLYKVRLCYQTTNDGNTHQ